MSVWTNAYNFQTENHGHQDWSSWVNYRAYANDTYDINGEDEYEITN